MVVEQVRAALPARLALAVVSAGIEQGRLTIGVVGSLLSGNVLFVLIKESFITGLVGLLFLSSLLWKRPIIFYTNGFDHWMWDSKFYPPRRVQGFFKKAELELLIQRRQGFCTRRDRRCLDVAVAEAYFTSAG